MSAGRKSSAEAGSFLVLRMALKMCLQHRLMHPSLSCGTFFESISMMSEKRKNETGISTIKSHGHLQQIKRSVLSMKDKLKYLCRSGFLFRPHWPVIALTTLSETSGISSSIGTHSIWMVTQCKALKYSSRSFKYRSSAAELQPSPTAPLTLSSSGWPSLSSRRRLFPDRRCSYTNGTWCTSPPGPSPALLTLRGLLTSVFKRRLNCASQMLFKENAPGRRGLWTNPWSDWLSGRPCSGRSPGRIQTAHPPSAPDERGER